jgi:hypothetical protein
MLKNQVSFSITFALIVAFALIACNDSIAQTHSIFEGTRVASRNISSRLNSQEPQPTEDTTDQDDQPSSSDFDLDEDDDRLEDDDDSRAPPQREAFGPWPRKGIRAINVDIREQSFNVPKDRSEQLLYSGGSQWSSFNSAPKVFAWAAPDIRYQPLYFEDVALERYGQTAGPYQQSFLSAVHLLKSTVLLPHQMKHDAPGSCDSPLGFCRPGNRVPYTIQRTYFGRAQR